jgi:hypothetical protein
MFMSKEVIEIREAIPNVDEQIEQILKPKPKRPRGTWFVLAELRDTTKVSILESDVPDAKGYRYPMHREIKIDQKQPIEVDSQVVEKVKTYIEHQMIAGNKSDAVLVCETSDRVKKARRKDKARAAPKAQAKMIIGSLNSIDRVVGSLFDRVNKLMTQATVDGVYIRLRIGDVNTLECFSNDGEDDVFCGFDL